MKEINLNHICKIEGHAHLTLKIEKNEVVLCQLKAAEGARFFEALTLSKKLYDIQEIVSRICGICSVAHSVAAVTALENAIGVKASEQQKILRELLMIGERIRSHATHLYFLALPDYLGYSSALTMQNKHKEEVNDALRLISVGNRVIEVLGGREMHPFLSIKAEANKNTDFGEIIDRLEKSKEIVRRLIKLFLKFDYPKLEREIDCLSLRDVNYATISGDIVSHSGKIRVFDYKKHLQENIKEYATSKFVLEDGKPYVVGAMARINNNFDRLDKESLKFLEKIKMPLNNPFYNLIAQAIEMLHLVDRSINLFRKIRQDEQTSELKIRAGRGVAAVEAPRGTLFHEYEVNQEGKVSYCNIVTPTAQNLNAMESDIALYVNKLLENGKLNREGIVLEIEKLIRAYDPCFSCSTHFLKVKWR